MRKQANIIPYNNALLASFALLLVLSVSGNSATKKDEDPNLTFYNKNIVQFSSNAKVGKTKDMGYGLFAKKEIKKGDEILKIRDSHVFTSFDDYPRSYFFFEFIHKDYLDFLVGRLLYEKFLTKRGFFYDYYLTHLNQDNYMNNAALWSQEDIERYWRRLGFQSRETFSPSKLNDKVRLVINENKKYLNQYEPKFPPEMFDEQEVKKAYALVQGVAFPFERYQWYEFKSIDPKTYKREVDSTVNYQENHVGLALLPFFDLINHENEDFDGKSFLLREQFDLRKPEVVDVIKRITGIENPQQASATLKKNDFNTTVLFDQLYFEVPRQDIKQFIKVTKGFVTLTANRDYKEGEEIKYSYGRRTNNNFLTNNGFVDVKNPFEAFEYENVMTELPDYARDVCYKLDCAPWNQKFVSYHFHRNQINHRFLKLIRIVGQNKETQEGNPFDYERALIVAKNGRFRNNYLELMVWKSYSNIIDYHKSFPTTIRQDRRDLAEELLKPPSEQDKKEINFIRNGIGQKEIVYRHTNYAWAQYIKILHRDIMMNDLKNDILIIVEDPERGKGLFFHNHKDV